MANQNDVNKALASGQNSGTSMVSWIESVVADVGKALPRNINPERLARVLLTCVRLNPVLATCTPKSLKGAIYLIAQTGLEPVAGQAYILPFRNIRNKGVLEAQFIMGYKGAAQLFYRNERSTELSWGVVKKNDYFDYLRGTEPYLKHREADGDRGETIGYYVCAKIRGGGRPFMFMSLDACMAHGREHSKTFNKTDGKFSTMSPWYKEPDSMCLKTVLLQLSKILPLSVETRRALEADESIRDFNGNVDNALDLPDKTDWKENSIETETKLEAQKPKDPEELTDDKSQWKCSGCGIDITLAEYDFSLGKFKAALCRGCQKSFK